MAKASDYGIEVHREYESRKGSRSPSRVVLWISPDGEKIQYDGDAVKWGRHYPTTTADAFAKWAGLGLSE